MNERTRATPVSMLERMLAIRACDENAVLLQAAGARARLRTCTGREASAVGVVLALAGQDVLVTDARNAGHLIARGADPGRMLAEVLGRRTGYTHGKVHSAVVPVEELGALVTFAGVGDPLSAVAGVALSNRMLGKPGVAAAFFDNAAATASAFHESLELAARWRLPVLYVGESGVATGDADRSGEPARRIVAEGAAAHGVALRQVRSSDVVEVCAAAGEAVATIRRTGRPFLLQVQAQPDVDPIELHQQRLLRDGRLSIGEVEFLARRARRQVAEAARFAAGSPVPEAPASLAAARA